MDVKEISEIAKKLLEEVLKKKAYQVAGISKEDNIWKVEVEVIEEEHIPSQNDIIGVYDAEITEDGKLMGWNRKQLRQRG